MAENPHNHGLFPLQKGILTPSRIIGGIVIITALFISLSLIFTQSIRLDEAQSIWFTTKSVPSILALSAEDVHVPLYILILHYWVQIFGSSIVIVRLFSFLFFLITIPIYYLFVRDSSTEEVAITAVCLFVLSPFILWYSAEGRNYALFTLISTVSSLTFVRLHTSNLRHSKIPYVIATIIGLYTHYFFLLLIFTQWLYFVGVRVIKAINGPHTSLLSRIKAALSREIFVYTGLVVFSVLTLIPWVYLFIKAGAGSSTSPLIPPPTTYNLFQTYINFIFGFQSSAVQNVLISFWPILTIFLFLVFTIRRKVHINDLGYLIMVTFVPVLIAYLTSFIKPVFLTRYLIFITPTLFFIIAWVMINSFKRISSWVVLATFIVLFGFIIFQSISVGNPVKENYQQVAEYLSHYTTPSDIIVATAPFTIYPIEYTYKGTTRITTMPEWNRYESGEIPSYNETGIKAQVVRYKKQYIRMYVVYSYDQGYEQKIKHYLDTSFSMLDKKQFSEKLEVRVYRLRY